MEVNILKIKAAHKSFGGLKAIDACSFTVKKGSITGLIGPNGAGKTTVFNLLTGLSKLDKGEVYFSGENITKWPSYKRARLGLTRTFQMIRIFPELTVLDNLKVALKDNKQGLIHIFLNQKKLQARLTEEAFDLLTLVHLEDKAQLLAGQLSYGQQKLLEILRAAALEPQMILLDEPAAGINRTMLKTIKELILHLQAQGRTVLVIEHDMNFIMELCEKVIVMDFGRVIAEGSPKKIQKDTKVLEAYLGRHAQD